VCPLIPRETCEVNNAIELFLSTLSPYFVYCFEYNEDIPLQLVFPPTLNELPSFPASHGKVDYYKLAKI